ncbi:MAG: dTDP-4-amino-4,6-dideoxygalactose transaminase [bacterium]|nr:dTDP-4-amino-4,6-dideoxygalactose transaminase [bacterium]
MKYQINFSEPTLIGSELNYVNKAVTHNKFSGNGIFTQKCERFLQDTIGVPRVLLVSSCTHALEMAALLVNVKGSEIIVPSFTFVSTANAFVLHGAKLIFCDIRPDTLNIDENSLPSLINTNTKAIVVLHYAGHGCNMAPIVEIARQHNLTIIEDNAHGLFGQHNGKNLGTFGSMSTHSFHGTKNFTCGEGGALFLNDPKLIERAEIIREKGTNRRAFLDGEVDKYTWVDVGSSYLMSDISAAFLYAQLRGWRQVLLHRQSLWKCYMYDLHNWAEQNRVQLPPTPETSTYHIFHLVMPSNESRNGLLRLLAKYNIEATFHYQPLHLSKMGKKYIRKRDKLAVTEKVSSCLVRLPLHHRMSLQDIRYVSSVVRTFRADK